MTKELLIIAQYGCKPLHIMYSFSFLYTMTIDKCKVGSIQ